MAVQDSKYDVSATYDLSNHMKPVCKNNKYSLNEPLVKICAIEKGYWERLVNIDEQRIVLFPSNFNEIQFKENIDVPFHILEKKFKYDFSVAMCHLKTVYRFFCLISKCIVQILLQLTVLLIIVKTHIAISKLYFQM